jgi:hypothetical protein
MATAALPNTDEKLETFCLIWLDFSVNKSPENRQAQQQLQTIINHVLTFEDDQKCLNYLKTLSKDDRVFLIASGKCGRQIVPQINNLKQLTSIFIYCLDKKFNEEWSQHFIKVKNTFFRFKFIGYLSR